MLVNRHFLLSKTIIIMDRESENDHKLFGIKTIELHDDSLKIFSLEWIKSLFKEYSSMLSLKLFVFTYDSSEISRTQWILMYLSSLIETMNLLSLLFYPSEIANDRDYYRYLWNSLLFSRFDNICAFTSLFPAILYLIISIILLQMLGQLYLCHRLINKRKNTPIFQYLLKILLTFLSRYFYIPIMTLLMTSFKYSISVNTFVVEYQINSIEITFPQSYMLTLICMIIFYCTIFVFFTLSYENRHFYSKFNLFSRAHSKIEKIRINFITLSIFGYSLFGVFHQEVFRFIYGSLCILLSITYYKYLPYYSSLVNAIKISSFACVGIIAMILEFGYFASNDDYSFFLTVFASPFLIGIVFYMSFIRASNISSDYKAVENIYEFEQRLRKYLINYDGDYETVISAFAACYIEKDFGNSFYLVIWLTNFCYYNMKYDSLSRIKIGAEVILDKNWDTEFQIHKLRETLDNEQLEYHEDLDYLNFRSKFEKIKTDDENFCYLLLALLKEMHLENNISSLQYTIIPEITKSLDSIMNEYKQFLALYPKNALVINMFSTFLSNIVHKNNRAMEIQSKSKSLSIYSKALDQDKISYFDDSNGLMIISGALSSFSIIKYANNTISNIFRQPLSTIIGSSLNSYVPYPFNHNHDSHMKKYLACCSNSDIKLPLNLFIQTQFGYLVECDIQIRCTALDSSPFFIVLMKERSYKREIGIISNEGIILNHSENFGIALGVNSFAISNTNINLYLNGIKFEDLQYSVPIIISNNHIEIKVVKSYRIIKKKHIDLVFLLRNFDDIEKWTSGRFDLDVEYSNYHRFESEMLQGSKIINKKVQIYEEEHFEEKADESWENNELENKLFSSVSASNRSFIVSNSVNASKGGRDIPASYFLKNQHFLYVLRLLRHFKYLSALLFFIVLGSQAMIVIYISQIYQIDSINFPISVAEASANLAKASLLSRGLYLDINNTIPDISPVQSLANASSNLFSLSNQLKTLAQNSECIEKSIFLSQIAQEFNPSTFALIDVTMIDILQDISQNNKAYLNNSDPNALNFIVINGLISSAKLHTLFNSIISCKMNEISAKEQIILILTETSVAICTISIILLIWSIRKMKKHYVIIWNTFCKFTHKYKTEMYQNALDRLIDLHEKLEYNENAEEVKETKKENLHRKNEHIPYIWRLCLYIILLSTFYIFIHAYTISDMHLILQFQLNSLQTNYNHRILSIYLNFWIREKTLESKNISLDSIYPEMILFTEYEIELYNVQNNLLYSQVHYLNDNFKRYLSNNNYNLLFMSDNNLMAGLYELCNKIIIDSYVITENESTDSLENFKEDLDNYQKLISNFIEEVITDVNAELIQQKNTLLVYSCIYIIFSYILYIVIFNYLLLDHYTKIKDIQRLEELIPSS